MITYAGLEVMVLMSRRTSWTYRR